MIKAVWKGKERMKTEWRRKKQGRNNWMMGRWKKAGRKLETSEEEEE
jgi:hypothetical protein